LPAQKDIMRHGTISPRPSHRPSLRPTAHRRIDILRLIVRMKRFYLLRALHLYFGLFISPVVLLFAISVISWYTHGSLEVQSITSRTATDLSFPLTSMF